MKHIVVKEHTQIIRWKNADVPAQSEASLHLAPSLYDRLKKFDQQNFKGADQIFAWGDMRARTRQWVGVVQLPGLQLEILPKIETIESTHSEAILNDERLSLLYMLCLAQDVPSKVRDVAHVSHRKAALSETLAQTFAERLLVELLRGQDRSYIRHEKNLRDFRGKLLISKQALHNAAHRERFYCQYEEFSEDTVLNRIFKAACLRLLENTYTMRTQDTLRHCLLILDSVTDAVFEDAVFDHLVLNRQNERFSDLVHFCRLVLKNHSPTFRAGAGQCFSLFFDMNYVFERFISEFLRIHVLPALPGYRLFSMSRKQVHHLLTCNGRGVLPLKPDLVIESPDGLRLVLDIKWKRPSKDKARSGAGAADLYQLFAYTKRYGCLRSILLYPHVSGISPQDLAVLDQRNVPSGESIGIRFVNIRRNLHSKSQRVKLAIELLSLIEEAFGEIRTCNNGGDAA